MGQLRMCDLDLRVVTPMMTGGADSAPEVRPPSVRGQLRAWLRALVGGCLGDDLGLVRSGEGAILGGATRASPVAVRATGDPATGPLPTDPRGFPGVQYLFWSAYQMRRGCLLPEQVIHLRLQARPLDLPPVEVGGQRIDADRAFDLCLAALWLSIQMGSLGFRARRGAGGWRSEGTPPTWLAELPPIHVRARTPAELAGDLARDLTQVRRFAGWDPVPHVLVPTSYNILHPDSFSLQVIDRSFATWWEALDGVGQAFRAFRRRQPDDYQGIKAILTGGQAILQTVKRAVFGLPLPFFFSSLFRDLMDHGVPPPEARARASATVSPRGADRRGSPFLVRVVQLAGDAPAYAVLFGLWRSQLTSDGLLVVRPRDRALRPVTVPAPADLSYVDEWFAHVGQNVGPLLSVTYS
ncbi:MAG: type III-B CRISPR module RAMP protein Cmr1 [Chloroflexi bacterium]|nr:type III-B CRISPR module RAMP protein Cmr1 [Chloroflexota bacterium]